MHKPPMLIMRSDNNSGHLRELGEAFEAENPPINIRSIGGAELDGTGVFAITFDNDTPARLARVEEIVNSIDGLTYTSWDGITFELKDEPGSLGKAAGKLEDRSINITSLLVIGTRGDRAIVLVGVPDQAVAASAREALEAADYFVYPEDHEH